MIFCFPHPPGSGGPGSFQLRLQKELINRGYSIVYARDNVIPDLVFVVGGTKKLFWLWKMKMKGVPILYRLDGINWLHRKKKVGARRFLFAIIRNLISKFIHAFIANKIVYQSQFVYDWWDRDGWVQIRNTSIIYNGVPVEVEKLHIKKNLVKKRLVILEGTIDYSPYALKLINHLAEILPSEIQIELYGNFEFLANELSLYKRVLYKKFIDRNKVTDVLTGAIYLSIDIHPACPNTVIEALSCGAPVVAFDTGSLKELVTDEAGIIVPYGSDPWELGYPNVDALVDAIKKVSDNNIYYSQNARLLAEKRYSIEDMTEKYVDLVSKLIVEKGKKKPM